MDYATLTLLSRYSGQREVPSSDAVVTVDLARSLQHASSTELLSSTSSPSSARRASLSDQAALARDHLIGLLPTVRVRLRKVASDAITLED